MSDGGCFWACVLAIAVAVVLGAFVTGNYPGAPAIPTPTGPHHTECQPYFWLMPISTGKTTIFVPMHSQSCHEVYEAVTPVS